MATTLEIPDDTAPHVKDALRKAANNWRLIAASGYRYRDQPVDYDMSPHYAEDRAIAARLDGLADEIARQGEAALLALFKAHNSEA